MSEPTLSDWREQEGDRVRYAFAAPEAERCTAVHRPGRDIFGQATDYIARCGKPAGHSGDHACSDMQAATVKWASGATPSADTPDAPEDDDASAERPGGDDG